MTIQLFFLWLFLCFVQGLFLTKVVVRFGLNLFSWLRDRASGRYNSSAPSRDEETLATIFLPDWITNLILLFAAVLSAAEVFLISLL
jgi:hypothetical protein